MSEHSSQAGIESSSTNEPLVDSFQKLRSRTSSSQSSPHTPTQSKKWADGWHRQRTLSENQSESKSKSIFGSLNRKSNLKALMIYAESVGGGIQNMNQQEGRREIFEKDESITKLVLLHTNKVPQAIGKVSQLQSKKLSMMENVVERMVQGHGVEIKTRKKKMKNIPLCALGNEIVDWMMQNLKLFDRWEAERFGQQLIDSGYLIPADFEKHEFSDDSHAFYTFQNIYFWPTQNWNPSDHDYAVYLSRRALKTTGKSCLQEEEAKRLNKLRVTLDKEWPKIMAGIDLQKDFLKKCEKSEKRIFLMRESSFWRLHRPLNTKDSLYSDIEEKKNAMEKQHMTDAEYEASLSKDQLLKHLEKRLMTLKITFETNKLKISSASKSLMQRVEIWSPVDTLLNPKLFNPYREKHVQEFPEETSESKPTKERVKIWTNSIKDLLSDPLAISYFQKFLKSEFSSENLDFYLECLQLENIFSADEWWKQARVVYETFVKQGSEREVNLDGEVRQVLIDRFENIKSGKGKTKQQADDVYIFHEAMQKMVKVMARDSYTRFTQSDLIKKLLE